MFAKTAILLVAAATVLGQSSPPTIDSPTVLAQCQPVQLHWEGGAGQPYFIAALPGGQTTATPLKDFGSQTGNTLTWTVDQPVGQSISLRVIDSKGVANYAAQVAVTAGPSTSCLTAGSNNTSTSGSTGSSGSSSGSSSGASSASAASSGAANSASKSSTSTPSGSAASASSPSASHTGAASPAFIMNGGLVAVAAGVVGAALF